MPRRLRSPSMLWAFLPYGVVAALHVAALAINSPLARPTKLLLMPLLAIPVLLAAPRLKPVTASALLIAALAFSWLGDSAGTLFPSAPTLPLMLLLFGIAHLAYILLFARLLAVRRMPRWALVYAAWWVAMLAILGPHAGALLPAVGVYGLVLGGTAALSTRCHPLLAIGGALFLGSDTLLALRLFLPQQLPSWSDPAIMLLYAVGQGLLVVGALVTLRKPSA